MPKLKTRKTAAKRFKITGGKKIMRRKSGGSHLLEHEDQGKKNARKRMVVVHATSLYKVERLLPYRNK
jgi:large subunit ribosomal protein L35